MARKKGYVQGICPHCLSKDLAEPKEWENAKRGIGGFVYLYKRCNNCGKTIKEVHNKILAGETADRYIFKTEFMFSEI